MRSSPPKLRVEEGDGKDAEFSGLWVRCLPCCLSPQHPSLDFELCPPSPSPFDCPQGLFSSWLLFLPSSTSRCSPFSFYYFISIIFLVCVCMSVSVPKPQVSVSYLIQYLQCPAQCLGPGQFTKQKDKFINMPLLAILQGSPNSLSIAQFLSDQSSLNSYPWFNKHLLSTYHGIWCYE